jgi:hypothetical protein
MATDTDPKDAEMIYNPPPSNPPAPSTMALAGLALLGAVAALVFFHLDRIDLAADFAVVAQFLSGLALAGMLYTGPPSNPPAPPRRYIWLGAITIGALGLALLGLRGGALGFDGPAAFGAVTAAGFAGLALRSPARAASAR